VADCCSAPLGFNGIIHRHSDQKSKGNTSNGKYERAKDGLGDVAMWLATMKSSVAPTLVRDVSDEDVVVAP
jgi:hypothetical protein